MYQWALMSNGEPTHHEIQRRIKQLVSCSCDDELPSSGITFELRSWEPRWNVLQEGKGLYKVLSRRVRLVHDMHRRLRKSDILVLRTSCLYSVYNAQGRGPKRADLTIVSIEIKVTKRQLTSGHGPGTPQELWLVAAEAIAQRLPGRGGIAQ